MDLLKQFIDVVLHLDHHLAELVAHFHGWTYAILFLVIFAETGLVITPFLPGDSLLFAVGAIAWEGQLNVHLLVVLLTIAAILGDTVNYWIGQKIGPRVFRGETSRFLNRKHLERTHEFFERYGGKTIILARFIPIIRTFAPFVAGVGSMTYSKFLLYNVIGGVTWIALFTYGGYFFSQTPFVKQNKPVILLAIIVISVLPGLIEYLRARRERPGRTVSEQPQHAG